MSNEQKYSEIISLVKQGKTVYQIADSFGVSHQSISLMIRRRLGKGWRKVIAPFDSREDRICNKCGGGFRVYPFSKRVFCSWKCFAYVKSMSEEDRRNFKTAKHKEWLKNPGARELERKLIRESIMRYPEKQKARSILNYRVRNGEILKPKKCSICDKKKRIEGHHEDYTKPLDVVWCCRGCHLILDKNMVTSV